MATVPRERLIECDGFRVEAPRGLLGWVEETWLGPDAEPAALAVRTLDGQCGLLLADDVVSVLGDEETIVLQPETRLLELGPPRLDGTPPLQASWSTTGATIEPPAPPGVIRRAVLARRPWRLAPPAGPRELAVWQIVLLLYAGIVLLGAIVMLAAFTVAAALS
jgi:hypothetical protein